MRKEMEKNKKGEIKVRRYKKQAYKLRSTQNPVVSKTAVFVTHC